MIKVYIRVMRSVVSGALLLALLGQVPIALAAPTGCTFYVNSTDNDTTHGYGLTLPAALDLAKGGTGGTGLNRPMTAAEMSQVFYCSYTVDGYLLTGGGGYVDTIRFANTLGVNPTITLSLGNPLPMLDTAGDVLDGSYSGIFPTLDASYINFNLDALIVYSNATITGIDVIGAPRYDFRLSGSGIHLNTVSAWKAGQAGIAIFGDNNTIDSANIGTPLSLNFGCGHSSNPGNLGPGVLIQTNITYTSSANNVIKNSTIGCNGASGVLITGSGALNNTIGPNNSIGLDALMHSFGNTTNGLTIGAGATGNQVVTSTIGNNEALGVSISADGSVISGNAIAHNTTSGIYVNGTHNVIISGNTIENNIENGVYLHNTYATHVGDNIITGNAYDGVFIDGTSSLNTIGGPTLGSNLSGNVLSGNSRYGLDILGPANTNIVLGNAIGASPYTTTQALGNHIGGILIDGSNSNTIGDTGVLGNTVYSSTLNGIVLSDGASSNTLNNNTVGGLWPNGLNGIVLNSGANNNLIENSIISANGGSGLVIQNSTTATNTVTGNSVTHNHGDGIVLSDNTFNNHIDSSVSNNSISYNQQGIHLLSGAHRNRISGNLVSDNVQNGLQLIDAGTRDNVITGTHVIQNGLAGIDESNGALANSWSHLSELGNGNLGINKHNPNADKPAITNVAKVAAQTTVVTGTGMAPSINSTTLVEVYLAANDPGGTSEGYIYLGSALTNLSGVWTITLNGIPNSGLLCLTAFETTATYSGGTSITSSEWGPSTCRSLYLPVILR